MEQKQTAAKTKLLYTAHTHTVGGREHGVARSSDGRLEVKLMAPGTAGSGTNPEQLFAAGWSGCFESALKIAAGRNKVTLPEDTFIDAEVDLFLTGSVFSLGARLNIGLPGLDHETARKLVDGASQLCPYSLAVKGNIKVEYNLIENL
jgi:Ohr subfamily peroxiredoxin